LPPGELALCEAFAELVLDCPPIVAEAEDLEILESKLGELSVCDGFDPNNEFGCEKRLPAMLSARPTLIQFALYFGRVTIAEWL
jgi:hypothetical protein